MAIPEAIHKRLTQALIDGDAEAAEAVTREALNARLDPLEMIQSVMVPALTEVGNSFQSCQIFLPELMMTGEAAKAASQLLEAALEAGGGRHEPLGVAVVGTVQGDIHDIGKNIVATMLKSHGFDVIDLGRNVAPSAFLDAAKQHRADVVLMSSLMTTTRPAQRNTVSLFKEVGVRQRHRMVVGGGSTNQKWADEIGADGYAPDAASAVELCKLLLDMPARG
jgi:corrinoid protein of di/trimethylamine methyltransferase